MTFNLDGPLQYTAFVKFLNNPTLIQGYFNNRFTRELTSHECLIYFKKKKETLYKALQNFLYKDSDIEVTFIDEDAFNWWNNLENIRCIPELSYDFYNRTNKPTGKYLLEVPSPPNKIFETE